MKAVFVAALAAFGISGVAIAQQHPGETVTPLLKQVLSGTNGLEANILHIEVGPGFQTERHVHPGHIFVYVLEGEIEIALDGEEPVRVSAGQTLYETPNKPMIGRNVSATEGARFVVFQVGESGVPLTVTQSQ